MKIWESVDKASYITLSFGGSDVEAEGRPPSTSNCGVGVLTGITLTLTVSQPGGWGAKNISLMRPLPANLTPDYIRQYKQIYGTDPPCPARQWDETKAQIKMPDFSPADIYDMVKNEWVAFVKASAGTQALYYGMYLLSNRVVDGEDTVFNADYPFKTRGTAWLMKLIRDTKCGTLITSPVVENVTHPGVSGIMVGIWIPPHSNVLHNKVGISKGFDESRLPEILKSKAALAKGTPKFVDYFYGRKSISSRLESANSGGGSIAVGAAAAR